MDEQEIRASTTVDPRLRWTLTVGGERRESAWLVIAAGRISAASAGAIVDAVNDAFTRGEQRVIVDLSRVDYISSAGVIALEALAGRAAALGARLVLSGVDGPVRLVFDLAGSDDVFETAADVDAAVVRLRARASSP